MAAAALGADAVIVQGSQPQAQRDYWQYPKTSGIAIKYTDDPPIRGDGIGGPLLPFWAETGKTECTRMAADAF